MGQAINATQMNEGTSVFVSKEVDDVLSKQEIGNIFCEHASGEGNDTEMQRALKTSDMSQYFWVRSIHETDSGVRVVVVTEFTSARTTIDLESSAISEPGFSRG